MNSKSKKSLAIFTLSGCLTTEALMQFVSGKLNDSDLIKAQKHISECPLCADATDGLRMWLKENSVQNSSNPESTWNQGNETPIVPLKHPFEPMPRSQSNDLNPNLFYNRTALLNENIKQHIHARALRGPEDAKRMTYKPFVWLAAAATIILFIGVGYVVWIQNQQTQRMQAQKQLRAREAALIAQIPENLAYPPLNSKVILNVKYNDEKGAHIPPVVTIVNEDIAQVSDKMVSNGNKAARTSDENEYTETKRGVESDVFREESGTYKGQSSKRTFTAKHSGGAMTKAESEEETSSVFISVQRMPSFPGGDVARKKYLAKHLRYPVQAVDDGIQGTVYVNFVVKTNGSLADIKILRGIGGGCDEEALRVVKKMPAWNPGYQNGRNVPVRYTLKVDFKIK